MPESIATAWVQIKPTTTGIAGELKNELSGAGKQGGEAAGKSIAGAIKGAVAAIGIGALLKETISAGADYEQLVGGVETLFKDSAGIVQEYASQAYETAGLSANEYMETVTSFSASLLSSLNGDTVKAANAADIAIRDMSDNANKMGSSMESIQNAYQGFAKQNYTMLDNLKLGYGGTKSEMERLLKDAEKISGVKYDMSNLSDVYEAIHVIQTEMGITGTTAQEAATTFSGSLASMKASAQNLLIAISSGQDLYPAIASLIDSIETFVVGNAIPMLERIITQLPAAIFMFIDNVVPPMLEAGMKFVTTLMDGIDETIPDLIEAVNDLIPYVVETLIMNAPALLDGAIKLFFALIEAIPIVLSTLTEQLPVLAHAVLDMLKTYAPIILKQAKTSLMNIVHAIPPILVQLVSDMSDVGRRMVQGLWNGIQNVTGWVLDKIRGFGSSILNGIKNIFGIHSPSKEMAWIGEMLDAGLASGIKDNVSEVTDAMHGVTAGALGAFDPYIGSIGYSGAGVPSGSVTNMGGVNLYVYGAQGQDVNQLAEVVMQKIQNATERRGAVYA